MNLIYLNVTSLYLFPSRLTKTEQGHDWESKGVCTCTSVYAVIGR